MKNSQAIRDFLVHVKNKQTMEDITGATVKIDVDKILYRGGYSKKFMNFVLENRDKEFTAELEYGYKMMYTFKEDDNKIKWLFHIDDLILVR